MKMEVPVHRRDEVFRVHAESYETVASRLSTERSECHAALRVPLREVQETLQAHHDYRRAGEGEAKVSHLQGHEGLSAVQRLHGADGEEELNAIFTLSQMAQGPRYLKPGWRLPG